MSIFRPFRFSSTNVYTRLPVQYGPRSEKGKEGGTRVSTGTIVEVGVGGNVAVGGGMVAIADGIVVIEEPQALRINITIPSNPIDLTLFMSISL